MGVERFQDREPQHFVYAVLCRDGDGPLYVKFGKTHRLHERLREVARGTPIPAQWFAFVEVPRYRQRRVERALHKIFAPRLVRGEWFKFDADSAEDRHDFNVCAQRVFRVELHKEMTWSKVSVAALDAHARERQQRFLRSPAGLAKARREERERKARRELGEYGNTA